MAQSSGQLHESPEQLGSETIDRHRAVVSIMEELEAVDWYDQRAAATTDTELADILRHNRDEEKEHASMVLEWLRRHDPTLDGHLRTYLFTTGSIVQEEVSAEGGGGTGAAAGGAPADQSLRIGALRDKEVL
jgi:ferritin-like protein